MSDVSANVTLDDGSEYGLNVDEATALERVAHARNLSRSICKFYQGADEVGAVLLSRLAVETSAARASSGAGNPLDAIRSTRPTVRLVWRVPNATAAVPAFESRSIASTVATQLEAAGAIVLAPNASQSADILFLVNNFGSAHQHEASTQRPSPPTDYAPLISALGGASSVQAIGFADVRYANGADVSFVKALSNAAELRRRHGCFAYAG